MTQTLERTFVTVRKIANEHLKEPDDEMMPVAIVTTPWEVKVIGAAWRDNAEQDAIYHRALPDFVRKHKATSVVIVQETWIIEGVTVEEAKARDFDANPVRDDPRRKRKLMVIELKSSGETLYLADIVTTTNAAPLLGEFEEAQGRDEGSLFYYIRTALREPLVEEFGAAWKAMAQHNLYLVEHKPLGEVRFKKWRQQMSPILVRVRAAVAALDEAGMTMRHPAGHTKEEVAEVLETLQRLVDG